MKIKSIDILIFCTFFFQNIFSQNLISDPYLNYLTPKNSKSYFSIREFNNKSKIWKSYKNSPDIIVVTRNLYDSIYDKRYSILDTCIGLINFSYDNRSNSNYSESIKTKLKSDIVPNQGYRFEIYVESNNFYYNKANFDTEKVYTDSIFLQIQFMNSRTKKKSEIINLKIDNSKSNNNFKLFYTEFFAKESINYDVLAVGYLNNRKPFNYLKFSKKNYISIFKINLFKIEHVPPENQLQSLHKYSKIVFFENNSDSLVDKEKILLINYLSKLIPLYIDTIRITGHADEKGSYEYNLKLSLRRANTVKSIIEKQIGNDHIKYIVKGNSYITSKKNKWKEKGRRAEIKFHLINSEIIPWYKVSQNCISSAQYSYTGLIQEASKFNNDPKFLQIRDKQKSGINKDYLNAKKYIYKHADNVNIIMINEAHHIPYHRTFAMELLDSLYSKGFKYLAVEGLAYNDNINSLRYKEPAYKKYLEKAKKLGFRLIAYDNNYKKKTSNPFYSRIDTSVLPQNQIIDTKNKGEFIFNSTRNKRDYIQYINLKKYLNNINDTCKMIIHCGYGHLKTKRTGYWYPLGYYLKEDFGSKLMSIDQVQLNECQYANKNELIKLIKPTKSAILTDKNGLFVKEEFDPLTLKYIKPYEIQILHPNDKIKPIISNNSLEINNLDDFRNYPILILIYDINSNPLTDVAFSILEMNNIYDHNTIYIPSNNKYKMLVKDKNNKIIYYGINNYGINN